MDAQVGWGIGWMVTSPEWRLHHWLAHSTVFATHFKVALGHEVQSASSERRKHSDDVSQSGPGVFLYS